MKATLTEVPSDIPDFVTYDIKVECPGGKPVSGYFTMPKNAAPKSLHAQVSYMGYGVASAQKVILPCMMMLHINAHGIEKWKRRSLLQGSEIDKYAPTTRRMPGRKRPISMASSCVRLRSLEFMKSQPAWNGKDLIASGGVRGFQALAAASLDKDVTNGDAHRARGVAIWAV